MELDFYTFDDIDLFNKFVRKEKKKGRTVIPVTVIKPIESSPLLTVYFYYKPKN